jgi:hypothetical protein
VDKSIFKRCKLGVFCKRVTIFEALHANGELILKSVRVGRGEGT